MSTVYEVANLAGVSTATVSRVIHSSHLVHPDTRDRVLAVIEELGYVPDGSAQGLSRRRKDIIGLAGLERGGTEVDVEKTGPLFMDELVHAVEGVLRGTECSLLLTFGRAGEQFQRRVWALSGKVDGLLIAEEVLRRGPLRALARHIPVVAIAGRPEETELDVVAVDNAAGMPALAAHLIDAHGYRRLGFLAGPADSPDAGSGWPRSAGPSTSTRAAPSTWCWTGTSPRPAGPPRPTYCWPAGHAGGDRVRERPDGDRRCCSIQRAGRAVSPATWR